MAKPEYYAVQQQGSQSPDTALIQLWLNGCSRRYPCIGTVAVDGSFGRGTRTAVCRFQCLDGQEMDGKVGRKTWEALYAMYAEEVRPGEQYPGVPLQDGTKGAAVKSAQQKLRDKGYDLTADGKFGPGTAKAVRAYQKTQGLPEDGCIGPATWACLYG